MYYDDKRIYGCQCMNCGVVFDYRKRIKSKNFSYAPCQGLCPNCMSEKISLIDGTIYKIIWELSDTDYALYYKRQ